MLIKQNQLVINGTTLEQSDLQAIANVASDVQAQIDTKAPINNAQFTGNVRIGIDHPSSGVNASDDYSNPDNYNLVLPAARSTNNKRGIGFVDSGNINSAILGVDEGTGGAQGLSLYTGTGASIVERVRIKSNGNVGIGTSSPQDTLHVVTDSATTNDTVDVVRIESTSSGTPAVGFGPAIEFRAERGNASADSVGRLGFVADNMTSSRVDGAFLVETAIDGVFTERLRIESTGNVGIGTDDPGAKLHVDVGAPSSTDQTLGRFQSEDSRQIGFVWDDSQSTLGIATLTNHAIAFHTNGNSSEKMRITSSGDVGIGNDPSDKLDIQGADNGITVRSVSANRPVITLVNDTTNMLQLSANGTYGAIGDGTDANRYFIFRDGDVGLAGVTDPRNKLHVGGAICNNKGVSNGTGIVQTVGRGMYHVLLTNNYGAGSNVRHAAYYVCVDYEGDDIVTTNTIFNNNSMSVSFSIVGGWLTVNSLPAGNNNAAVFGM